MDPLSRAQRPLPSQVPAKHPGGRPRTRPPLPWAGLELVPVAEIDGVGWVELDGFSVEMHGCFKVFHFHLLVSYRERGKHWPGRPNRPAGALGGTLGSSGHPGLNTAAGSGGVCICGGFANRKRSSLHLLRGMEVGAAGPGLAMDGGSRCLDGDPWEQNC